MGPLKVVLPLVGVTLKVRRVSTVPCVWSLVDTGGGGYTGPFTPFGRRRTLRVGPLESDTKDSQTLCPVKETERENEKE